MNFKLVKKLKLLMLVIIIFSIFHIQFSSFNKASSFSNTRIIVNPAILAVNKGENFSINIDLIECPLFNGILVNLTYNNTALDLLQVTCELPWTSIIITNETTGEIRIEAFDFENSLEGTLTIATISFNAKETSKSTLLLHDTVIYDPSFNKIAHETINGIIEVIGNLELTVKTDKSAYKPGENITIYGNFTMEGTPINGGLVGIEMYTPLGGQSIMRTITVGQSPTWQNIILYAYTCDQYGSPKKYFSAGDPMYINATIQNLLNESRTLYIAVNTFDKSGNLLGYGIATIRIGPLQTSTAIMNTLVPSYAVNGTATAYVSVFSNWLRNGGFPICPAKAVSFTILNGQESTSYVWSNITNCSYNLTFQICPSSLTFGYYDVYVSAYYKIKQVTAKTKLIIANYYVDDDAPADFTSIQAAIDSASTIHRDTIFIYNGTYYENLNISKGVILVGESPESTIIDGGGTTPIKVSSNKVMISRLKIQNGNLASEKGIEIVNSDSILLHNNLIVNNSIGISIFQSNYAIIRCNKLLNNFHGIQMVMSNSSTLSNNTIKFNAYGTTIKGSTNNIILYCDFSENTETALILNYSQEMSIKYNNFQYNKCGIYISNLSDSNEIYENNYFHNNYGLKIEYSNDNKIFENNVTDNTSYGITIIGSSSNNRIYHNNFVNNTHQVYVDAGPNTWDNGYPSGGNYWSDYLGEDEKSGSAQNLSGSDGIGDVPYEITEYNQDNYPLMRMYNLPDLGLKNVVLSKTIVGKGYPVKITVYLLNYAEDAVSADVAIYYNDTLLEEYAITVPGRKLKSFTVTLDTISFSYFDSYQVSAYVYPIEGELVTSDNNFVDGIFHVTILGDLDNNKEVGTYDLYLFGIAYGSLPGQQYWNPNADFDDDCTIGTYDLYLFGKNYGKKVA